MDPYDKLWGDGVVAGDRRGPGEPVPCTPTICSGVCVGVGEQGAGGVIVIGRFSNLEGEGVSYSKTSIVIQQLLEYGQMS